MGKKDRGEMFPVRPPALFLPFKDGFVGLFVCLCLLLLERVHCFEPVHEDELGHLLDGLERVGETNAPEFVPEGIDL